jgi:pre-mRNA-processing factor 6
MKEFDEFEGNDAGLFKSYHYDEDDLEADAIWEAVDKHMDNRRRDRREARLKKEIEEYRAANPKITEQFADLKRKLGTVSEEDWDAIPDIGDYTIKKKPRNQSFIPVPDTLLARAMAEKETLSSIDAAKLRGPGMGGLETPMGNTPVTDLTAVGEGRGTVLSLKLDRMADSVSGQTVVDPKGYLTDLKSMKISTDAEIGDIKKARLLLKSVIQSNPQHAPGWIAAARLEEFAGKVQAARQFIQKGCEKCPQNEDVWLEAVRLQTPENARAVLARGVQEIPTSVKLWLQAAQLEDEPERKQRVLRKALEHIPSSVKLWKTATELASEDDAKVLLARAVECCPQHTELWLALARLETYENARKVLNRARETIPTEPLIWISASKLEETHGNEKFAPTIINRAIKSLSANNVVINREYWLKEAESAEKADSIHTCQVGSYLMQSTSKTLCLGRYTFPGV